MKKALLFFVLLLLTCRVTVAQTASANDRIAVAQAVDALRKVMIDPDRAALTRLTADSLSYGHSGGNIEDKAAFVEALVSGKSDFQTMDLTNQTISIVDQTALVRHQLSGVTNNNGVVAQVNLSVLLIWIKQGGIWKLLARQAIKRV